uniref:Uncharacterized protein n=1 Tax=Rangifer tarandus platyrhynchus TaxID=3082113 RepID=A0ACB0EI65_RANTA|nr:unnamed protein product [Rangifer tarandus platyrhynchus]
MLLCEQAPGERRGFELTEGAARQSFPPLRGETGRPHTCSCAGPLPGPAGRSRLSAPGRCSELRPSSGKEPLPRQVQPGSLAAELYTDPAGSGGEK